MSNPLPSGYEPGLFGKVALWVLGHRKITAASVLLIAIVSVILGIPPKVDSDVLTMLPPDKPVIAATKKLNEEEREREKKDQSHSRRSSEKIQV